MVAAMPETDAFDELYKETRDSLLLQTYLLTGDLPAARGAVREAFVVAWHHWAKVTSRHDPGTEIRPRAFATAQRRATTRPWHKEKGVPEGVAATLDALGDLDWTPRRLLVLAEVAGVALGEAAREVGVTAEDAARHLAVARADFAIARDLATPEAVEAAFAEVGASLVDVRWPRPSILRRAGARRRRTHTAGGVALAVVAVLASGVVVHDASGIPTSLARSVDRTSEVAGTPTPEPEAESFGADLMLTADEVTALAPQTTFAGDMTDNTGGDGLVVPCQQSRYADVDGLAGYVSSFASAVGAEPGPVAAYQVSELSRTPDAAVATYATWRTWFAGCTTPRANLVATLDVTGVGDEASAFVISVPGDPGRILTAGVARTGDVTTVVASDATSATQDPRDAVAQLLGVAVDRLCAADDTRTCSTEPAVAPRLPFPVGEAPEMLDVVDLPPVPGVPLPWTGTRPATPEENQAATVCDRASFSPTEVVDPVTRTFVITDAGLPDTFGLTQTVGALGEETAADGFVGTIAERLAGCTDQDLVTSVDVVGDVPFDDGRLIAWRLELRVGEDATVSILMGVARSGSRVTQVGFVPDGDADLGDDAFVGVLTRAHDRLAVVGGAAG